MVSKTVTLHIDFHKSLPSPKVSAQDWYYSLKIRTNLMGIYCANEELISCFMYDDSIAGMGPNEVISLLDYFLRRLQAEQGQNRYDHLVVWCDNSPSQFKHNYLFFYLDYLVKRGDFLRTDLKFLLEGHSYSVCDRHFGNIQKVFNSQEKIYVPRDWATALSNGGLSNVRVYWVTLDMIKDYKSYLKLQYVSRNRDLQNEKFEVKQIAWINFGIGERADDSGNLEVVHHPESAFVRFSVDSKQQPKLVSYKKIKQARQLREDLLTTLSRELRPIPEDVKKHCANLAHRYLNENAERFYAALPCFQVRSTDDRSRTSGTH